jgi:hypothetical protein
LADSIKDAQDKIIKELGGGEKQPGTAVVPPSKVEILPADTPFRPARRRFTGLERVGLLAIAILVVFFLVKLFLPNQSVTVINSPPVVTFPPATSPGPPAIAAPAPPPASGDSDFSSSKKVHHTWQECFASQWLWRVNQCEYD